MVIMAPKTEELALCPPRQHYMPTPTDWSAEFGVDSSLGVRSARTHLWTLSAMNPRRNTAGENTAGRSLQISTEFWSHNLQSSRTRTVRRWSAAHSSLPVCLRRWTATTAAFSPLRHHSQARERKTSSHSFKIKASCFRLGLDCGKDGNSVVILDLNYNNRVK